MKAISLPEQTSLTPVFYREMLQPVIDQLDSFVPLVTPEMEAATVEKVYEEAVDGWNNIRFIIEELRRRYLSAALATGP